ncbi:MAG: hypothetical protein HFI67_04345 [Lachnospiraceae bacterium]|jgi:hypothetical protein|nr:hypothetical protein [Lachnospiraceae bacterium]
MGESRDLLRRLMIYYASDYELLCPYQLGDTIYDVYASYSHYHCFEHAFIRSTLTLSRSDLNHFADQLATLIEPEMVRNGRPSPPQSHIYTYVTGIFISEQKIPEDIRRMIRRFRYYRGYGYYKNGYCQARIAAFDMEAGSLIINPAAKELIQEYQRILK